MTFTLKKVRDGESTTFTLQKILEILGNKASDEIRLDDEAYRISSFEAAAVSGGVGGSGSSTGVTFVWEEFVFYVSINGQTQVQLQEVVPEFAYLLLTVNGVYYETGSQESYHIVGSTFYWHGSFDLEPTDKIRLRYQIAV